MKAGAHHWCRKLRISCPAVWGAYNALCAGKGRARLRREAWENKSPSQGAPGPSLPFPTSCQCSFATATPHCAPHTSARTEDTRPPHQVAPFTLGWCLPHSSQLQRPPCSHGHPDPSYPTKPDQSRGSASDKEGQRFFSCLVDSLELDLGRCLRICCAPILCKQHNLSGESQAGTPRSHLCFPEGLHWSLLLGAEPCSSPPAWQGLKIQLGPPGEQAGASEHGGKKGESCFSSPCYSEGKKIQVNRQGA